MWKISTSYTSFVKNVIKCRKGSIYQNIDIKAEILESIYWNVFRVGRVKYGSNGLIDSHNFTQWRKPNNSQFKSVLFIYKLQSQLLKNCIIMLN